MILSKQFNYIKNLFPWNTKGVTHSEQKYTLEVFEHHIDLEITKGTSIPLTKILKLILLNPWSALGTPVIDSNINDDGKTLLRITFKILKEEKGKEIEQGIRLLFSDQ